MPAPQPTAKKADLSRPAWLKTPVMWECGFPWEAERDGLGYSRVIISVTVRADGTPESAAIGFHRE